MAFNNFNGWKNPFQLHPSNAPFSQQKIAKNRLQQLFSVKKKNRFHIKQCFLATAISISKWIAFFSVIVAPEILGKEIIDNNDFERIEKVGTKITLNVGTLRLLIFCFKVLIGSKPLASSKFVALACVVVSKISAASVIYFHEKNHEHNFCWRTERTLLNEKPDRPSWYTTTLRRVGNAAK